MTGTLFSHEREDSGRPRSTDSDIGVVDRIRKIRGRLYTTDLGDSTRPWVLAERVDREKKYSAVPGTYLTPAVTHLVRIPAALVQRQPLSHRGCR